MAERASSQRGSSRQRSKHRCVALHRRACRRMRRKSGLRVAGLARMAWYWEGKRRRAGAGVEEDEEEGNESIGGPAAVVGGVAADDVGCGSWVGSGEHEMETGLT